MTSSAAAVAPHAGAVAGLLLACVASYMLHDRLSLTGATIATCILTITGGNLVNALCFDLLSVYR
eukprot:1768424-Prymnesium_polylepis.1